MADTFDEEVILEGSEIHKHLINTGFSEFEHFNNNENKYITERRTDHGVFSFLKNCWNFISRVPLDLSHECSMVERILHSLNGTLYTLQQKHMTTVINTILKSSLLVDYDCLTIANLMPEEQKITHTPWKSSLWGMGAACVSFLLLKEVVAAVSFFILVFCNPIHSILRWRYSANITYLKKYINIVQKLRTTMRKTLQLMQEHEYVTMGFLLLTREGVVSLQSLFPLLPYAEYKDHYLSLLPEKDLGIDGKSDQKYSMAQLKNLNQMFNILMSEYLQRLALCFCPQVCWNTKRRPSLKTLLGDLPQQFNEIQDDLRQYYEYYRLFGIEENDRLKLRMDRIFGDSTHNEKSQLFDLHVSVHSLGLHLQSSLLSIRELEDTLEGRRDVEEPLEYLGGCREHLEFVKQEIMACRNCVDEGFAQIEYLLNRLNPRESSPVTSEPPNASALQLKRPSIKLIDESTEEPERTDEIFEMDMRNLADDEFSNNDEDDDCWTAFLAADEKEKRKLEKEQSLRVYRELQSVLVRRAKDWREREENAKKTLIGVVQNDTRRGSTLTPPIEEPEDEPVEVSCGGGFGFNQQLAAQAAAMSRRWNKHSEAVEDVFIEEGEEFGDDFDSDDE